MYQKLSRKELREELIDIGESIKTLRNKKTGEELSGREFKELMDKFILNISHPLGDDLLFYPELVGLPHNATVEEIVDFALPPELPRQELVELVETLLRDKKGEEALPDDKFLDVADKFEKNINHPGGLDLIYSPQSFGLPPEPTADEIVELAMKGTTT